MQKGSILRPKYEEDMDEFISGDRGHRCRPASRPRTGTRSRPTFTTMVDEANAYHEKYDKGFLRWQLPATPPPDLDLTATLTRRPDVRSASTPGPNRPRGA